MTLLYLKDSIRISSQSEYPSTPRVASGRVCDPGPASNLSTKQNKVRVVEAAKNDMSLRWAFMTKHQNVPTKWYPGSGKLKRWLLYLIRRKKSRSAVSVFEIHREQGRMLESKGRPGPGAMNIITQLGNVSGSSTGARRSWFYPHRFALVYHCCFSKHTNICTDG